MAEENQEQQKKANKPLTFASTSSFSSKSSIVSLKRVYCDDLPVKLASSSVLF